MTNELSLAGWGKLAQYLPKFRDYHQALYDELEPRKLDIKRLATDASPISFWETIQWARENMDEITGITNTVFTGKLAMYTTTGDRPSDANGLTVTGAETGKPCLEWEPNSNPELCYYRVYRSAGSESPAKQIASTITTRFIDPQVAPGTAYTYQVPAVDQYGNAGP
jgi:hypothetical protein